MRFVTYNAENFFDTKDDTLKNDDDFLPEATRHWTAKRYREKVAHVSRVIATIGGWTPPAVVGLCEVENDYVMRSLTVYGPLKELGYKAVHYESPDSRGIDVAILYRPEEFTPIVSRPLRVETGDGVFSRDILYVMGTVDGERQIHLFQVHFPSRREGQKESEPNRMKAAKVVREAVDSIFAADGEAAIVIMGDFNDTPEERALTEVLQAKPADERERFRNRELYNLTYRLAAQGNGSYFYKGRWEMLDQIIVSGNLLDESERVHTDPESAGIFRAPWLLEQNRASLDSVPRRTYKGMRYNGGYSDHLPVYFDLERGDEKERASNKQ